MPFISFSESEIEADLRTTVNPNSGLASIGRRIGKKYPGQRLRIIVLKGVVPSAEQAPK